MQNVKTMCPGCGDIDLKPSDITVTVNKMSAEGSTYTFTCPECFEVITKSAGPEVQRLLKMAIGVTWNVVHAPAELAEPHYSGPALTEQDVADFIIDMNLTPDHLFSILAGRNR